MGAEAGWRLRAPEFPAPQPWEGGNGFPLYDVVKGREEVAFLGSIQAWNQLAGRTLCVRRTGSRAAGIQVGTARSRVRTLEHRPTPLPKSHLLPIPRVGSPHCQRTWQPLAPPFPGQPGSLGLCQASCQWGEVPLPEP